MAAFGVPQAHEDDAERAVRAGFAILDARARARPRGARRHRVRRGRRRRRRLDLRDRRGGQPRRAPPAGAPSPNEILIGPGARAPRSAAASSSSRSARSSCAAGASPIARAARRLRRRARRAPVSGLSAPLVGRESELELLENTYERTVARPARAPLHDLRRARRRQEPARARVRRRRSRARPCSSAAACPYGEGVTYWPLAEMVKASAGITDDDPLDEASEKLRDVLRGRGRRRPARARRRRARGRRGRARAAGDRLGRARVGRAARRGAAARPRLRGHPLGRGAAARADRAPRRLGARGAAPARLPRAARSCSTSARAGAAAACARRRSSSSRSAREESARARRGADRAELDLPIDTATRAREDRGQPALRRGDGPHARRGRARRAAERIPDTLQALIAARIDRLPAGAAHRAPARLGDRPHLLARRARAPVAGARRRRAALDDLLLRDFVVREPRSSISGEEAYRFKHVLIREVAYAGLSKVARADLHHALRRLARRARRRRAARDPRLPPRPGRAPPRPSSTAPRRAELRERGGGSAREGRPPRALARGEPQRAQAAAARGRARADARAPLPRRPRRVAARRLPRRRRRDGARWPRPPSATATRAARRAAR